jgi:hypothetical protein
MKGIEMTNNANIAVELNDEVLEQANGGVNINNDHMPMFGSEVAVQIDHNHMPAGDDLISVQIDHNHLTL